MDLFYEHLKEEDKEGVVKNFLALELTHMTTRDFKLICELYNIPKHEVALKRFTNGIMEGLEAVPFEKLEGAYLKLDSIKTMISLILKKHDEATETFVIIRISWDNANDIYKTTGHTEHFEILTLQVITPKSKVQSSYEILTVAIAKMKESVNSLEELKKEFNVDLIESELKSFLKNRVKIMKIADWMGLVAFHNLAYPNRSSENKPWCACCRKTKEEINRLFKENWNREWETVDEEVRYCFGHGVARILSFLLNRFFDSLPDRSSSKTQFLDWIHETVKDWKEGWSISWEESKHILFERNWNQLCEAMKRSTVNRFRILNDKVLWNEDMLHLGLECLFIYLKFAYTVEPDDVLYKTLDSARKALCWIAYIDNWDLDSPAFHFLIGHAVRFAKIDGGAYITLQEGTEHKNSELRQASAKTYKKGNKKYQQLVDHQTKKFMIHLRFNFVQEKKKKFKIMHDQISYLRLFFPTDL